MLSAERAECAVSRLVTVRQVSYSCGWTVVCGGVSCDCRRHGADEFTLYAHALCVV